MMELLASYCNIPRQRLSIAGHADNAPVADNATEEGRRRNRRCRHRDSQIRWAYRPSRRRRTSTGRRRAERPACASESGASIQTGPRGSDSTRLTMFDVVFGATASQQVSPKRALVIWFDPLGALEGFWKLAWLKVLEGLGPELETEAFGEHEIFLHGEIEVPGSRGRGRG